MTVSRYEPRSVAFLCSGFLAHKDSQAHRSYSLVLEEIKEENDWKNDLVLFWLDATYR